jgi:hypothetical protein
MQRGATTAERERTGAPSAKRLKRNEASSNTSIELQEDEKMSREDACSTAAVASFSLASSHVVSESMSSSRSTWSWLYRDALLSILSFVDFKELPSVLVVC